MSGTIARRKRRRKRPRRRCSLVARKPLSLKWSLPGNDGAVGPHRPDHDVEGRRCLGTALSPMHIGVTRASVYTNAIGAVGCGETVDVAKMLMLRGKVEKRKRYTSASVQLNFIIS